MLKHKYIRIIFWILFVVNLILFFLISWSFYFLVGLIFLYSVFLISGSFLIRFNFYVDGLHKGDYNKKQIALTFDDGPHYKNSIEILNVLEKNKVKASFFYTGKNIENSPGILKKVYQKGHLIGNHGYSHSGFFDFFPAKKMIKEISATEKIIYNIINKRCLFFRPPFGVTNPALRKAINFLELKVIGWSFWSADLFIKDKNKLLKRITSKIHNGSIVVFHEQNKTMLAILDDLIKILKKEQYQLVTLDRLLNIPAYD